MFAIPGKHSFIVAVVMVVAAICPSAPSAAPRGDVAAGHGSWTSHLSDESGRIVAASGLSERGVPIHFSSSLVTIGERIERVTDFAHGGDLLRIRRAWDPATGMTVVVTDGVETQRIDARSNAPEVGVTVVYTLPDGRAFAFLVDGVAGNVEGDLEGLRRAQETSSLRRSMERFARLAGQLGNGELLEMRILEPTYWDCVDGCSRGCKVQCADYCGTVIPCNICYSACYLGCNIGCY